MTFISYTFKPAFGLVVAIVSLIVVVLLAICFLYDRYIIFIMIICLYTSFLGVMFAASYYTWRRYKAHEVDEKIRDIHRNNFTL